MREVAKAANRNSTTSWISSSTLLNLAFISMPIRLTAVGTATKVTSHTVVGTCGNCADSAAAPSTASSAGSSR